MAGFGDSLLLTAMSGEMSAEYGLRMVKEFGSRFGQVWPVAYANGIVGYVCSERQLPEGGYEVLSNMQYIMKPVPMKAARRSRYLRPFTTVCRNECWALVVTYTAATVEDWPLVRVIDCGGLIELGGAMRVKRMSRVAVSLADHMRPCSLHSKSTCTPTRVFQPRNSPWGHLVGSAGKSLITPGRDWSSISCTAVVRPKLASIRNGGGLSCHGVTIL